MKKIGLIILLLFIGLANIMAQNWDTTTLLAWKNGAFNDITFLSPSHGFIIGDSNTFLETKDAGKTWEARSPLLDFPNGNRNKDFKEIIFLNDTLGFMRNNYELLQTKDAGNTWVARTYGGYVVKQFHFFNNTFTVFSDQAFGSLLTSVYSIENDTFNYQGDGLFPIYTIEKLVRLNDSNPLCIIK